MNPPQSTQRFRPMIEILEQRVFLAVTSQGVEVLRVDIARATYGVDGTGVKVGIVSDSFNHLNDYNSDVFAGELPAGVQVLKDSNTSFDSDEGRAMAQIVYDVAPGAQILFHTCGDSPEEMADAIIALMNAGADVIVDDIGFPNEPFFQDGVVTQAVNQVVAAGVTFVTAAGNSGREAYESAWRFGQNRPANSPSGFPGGATFDFNPAAGIDDLQAITIGPQSSAEIWLQWDQPWGNVSTDIDVYVLNSSGTTIDFGNSGETDNIASGEPLEIVYLENNSNSSRSYNLLIVKHSGPDPVNLKYVNVGDEITSIQYATNSGSVVGHAMAGNAISVGAADYANTPKYGTNPPLVEDFSSRGPQTITLAENGTRLATPIVRSKPDLVGPDGVRTTVDDFDAFYGTSAAAPHIAGVAALLLDAKPTLTPAQVLAALKVGAIDMDDPSVAGFQTGFDNATGFGLVQADKALASVLGSAGTGSIAGKVFNDPNSNGVQNAGEAGIGSWTVYLDTNNNGVKDAGETSVVTDASGNYLFSNLANGTYNVKQVLKPGYRKTLPGIGAPGYSVTTTGSAVTGRNFGNTTNIYLAGTVFNDANNNGVKDAGEAGIPSTVVNIMSNGQLVATRTTDDNGFWTVKGLSAGTGEAVVVAPSNYTIRAPIGGKYTGGMTTGQQNGNLNFGLRRTTPVPPPATATILERDGSEFSLGFFAGDLA